MNTKAMEAQYLSSISSLNYCILQHMVCDSLYIIWSDRANGAVCGILSSISVIF